MSGNQNITLEALNTTLKTLTQIVSTIVETQTRHTDMLQKMLTAATKPLDGPSPTANALNALVSATNNQTATMQVLTQEMLALPVNVRAAMKTEVDRALAS